MKTNKLFKSVMTIAMSGLMILGASVPVLATVDEYQNPNGTTGECEVVYNLETSSTPGSSTTDGNYMITIPKKITLGSDKSSTYTVTVNGDIASNKQVTVTPDSSFTMKDVSVTTGGKADVTANVTQEETSWNWSEAADATEKEGSIIAEDLSAGSWAGTFNFTIALEDLA